VKVDRVVFERVGLVKGAQVALYLGMWIAVARKLGKFPTTVEYAEVAGKSERQAWRQRAKIHAAFPGDEMQELVEVAAGLMQNGMNPLDVELPARFWRRSA
jgi:hypothetical protein